MLGLLPWLLNGSSMHPLRWMSNQIEIASNRPESSASSSGPSTGVPRSNPAGVLVRDLNNRCRHVTHLEIRDQEGTWDPRSSSDSVPDRALLSDILEAAEPRLLVAHVAQGSFNWQHGSTLTVGSLLVASSHGSQLGPGCRLSCFNIA